MDVHGYVFEATSINVNKWVSCYSSIFDGMRRLGGWSSNRKADVFNQLKLNYR